MTVIWYLNFNVPKDLLEHSHAVQLCIGYGCFHAIMVELISCNRHHMAYKTYLLVCPLQKIFADSCSRMMPDTYEMLKKC